jgi:hypothetical protein
MDDLHDDDLSGGVFVGFAFVIGICFLLFAIFSRARKIPGKFFVLKIFYSTNQSKCILASRIVNSPPVVFSNQRAHEVHQTTRITSDNPPVYPETPVVIPNCSTAHAEPPSYTQAIKNEEFGFNWNRFNLNKNLRTVN